MFSLRSMSTLIIAFLAVVLAIEVAEGQSTPPASCVQNIIPCATFLNSTSRPPNSCCDPLRETVTNQLECLCNLYSNPGLLSTFNISLAEALRLPASCGISTDISACNTALAPGSSTLPPPGTRGGNNNGNGVGRIGSTGLSSLLVILGASFMLW